MFGDGSYAVNPQTMWFGSVEASAVNRLIEFKLWWATRDSNPDELPHTPLKRARLPVPPAARLEPVDSTEAALRWYPRQDANDRGLNPSKGRSRNLKCSPK